MQSEAIVTFLQDVVIEDRALAGSFWVDKELLQGFAVLEHDGIGVPVHEGDAEGLDIRVRETLQNISYAPISL